jgi:hypothetical protein
MWQHISRSYRLVTLKRSVAKIMEGNDCELFLGTTSGFAFKV